MMIFFNVLVSMLILIYVLKNWEIFIYSWYFLVLYFSVTLIPSFYYNTYLPEIDIIAERNVYSVLSILFIIPFVAVGRVLYEATFNISFSQVSSLLMIAMLPYLATLIFELNALGDGSILWKSAHRNITSNFMFIPTMELILCAFMLGIASLGDSKLKFIAIINFILLFVLFYKAGHAFGGYMLIIFNFFLPRFLCREVKTLPLKQVVLAIFTLSLIFSLLRFSGNIFSDSYFNRLLGQGQVFYYAVHNSQLFNLPINGSMVTNFIGEITLKLTDSNGYIAYHELGSRLSGGYPSTLIYNLGTLGGFVVVCVVSMMVYAAEKTLRPHGRVKDWFLFIYLCRLFFLFDFLSQGNAAPLVYYFVATVILLFIDRLILLVVNEKAI